MNHNEYWTKRSIIAEKAMYKRLEAYDVVLEREFYKARAKMDEKIYQYLSKIATDNKISLHDAKKLLNSKELAGFRLSLEEYIQLGKGVMDDDTLLMLKNASHAVRISRLQALQTELNAVASQLWGEVGKTGMKIRELEAADGYARMIADLSRINKDVRMSSRIDKGTLDRILREPWGPDGKKFSKKVWDNRDRLSANLSAELASNAMGVQSIDEAAANIAKAMNTSAGSAKRLVHTEAAAARSGGKKATYKRIGATGYQIIATLDNRTSELCQSLDGKVYDVDDYEVGVTANPFHPW